MTTRHEAGFTLVEMLVALALLALISLAGFALVETVLSVQARTDGRTARLGRIERTLYLFDADFTQATAPPVQIGPMVTVQRQGAGRAMLVGYTLIGGALVRLVDGVPRAMIDHVRAADWRFHRTTGWSAVAPVKDERDPPDALALTIMLAPIDGQLAGTLRRVVALPARP